jgi:tRNA-dihydrouridine synthase
VQLLVANERELLEALQKLEALAATTHPHLTNLRAVDLNFGCPSPEVIKVGAGPALLKRRGKLEAIFKTLRAWQQTTTLPVGAVGAKIRLGLNRLEEDQQVYLPIVELANAHLDYLTIHARHARQESTETPRWSAIAEAKAKATVPILGNGDVVSRADFERLVRETGSDGAMIARGAIRSPWVFRGLNQTGSGSPESLEEIDACEGRYRELSARFGTKPKYLLWHAEGFERMRKRLRGEREAGSAMPANEHMK